MGLLDRRERADTAVTETAARLVALNGSATAGYLQAVEGRTVTGEYIGWVNPKETVALALDVGQELLIVWRQRPYHPLDWDIADALMHRIAHRDRRRRSPSLITQVSFWEVREVTNAREALDRQRRLLSAS